MKDNKAFVGHSFAPEDQEVVAKFLKYFEQLEDLVPSFEWDHAEAAEPLELATKVKAKFAGKNLFIGICTRREFAIAEDVLSNTFFHSDSKKVRTRDLSAKASDWVTQEIGYALGRGMSVLLLQEVGIRRPGGLQGDQEYIPFTRDRPEQAYGKILEMLSALSPKVAETAATSDEPKPDEKAEAKAPSDNFWTPAEGWNQSNYRLALTHLLATDRDADAQAALEAFAKTDEGGDPIKVAELESHFEFVKLIFGKGGSYEKLNAFAKAHSDNAEVLDNFAKAQRQFDNHTGAGKTLECAARVTTDRAESLSRLGRAAVEFAKAGDTVRSEAIISEIRSRAVGDPVLEKQLATSLADLLELKKDDDGVLLSLERKVDVAPDDYDARFQLAYKHSQAGNQDLAFYHYLKIPYDNRTAIGWNNLGVSYDHFDMPSMSVAAYRKAEEMGETLAMANLGYKFIQAGFTKEAKASFDRGFAVDGHHKNIEAGLSALTSVDEREEENRKEVLAKLAPKAEFYRFLGAALAADQIISLPTTLSAQECTLVVKVDGDKFEASGTYKRESNGLAQAVFGGAKEVREYAIKYAGRIVGRQIEGTVQRTQTSGPQYSSLLALSDDKAKMFMYLTEFGDELKVMENPAAITPTYYSLIAA